MDFVKVRMVDIIKLFNPNACNIDLSDCSEEYRKAYYDGWNNCNLQHASVEQKHVDPHKFKVGDIVQYITDSTDRREIISIDKLCEMYITDDASIWFEDEDDWKFVVNAADEEQKQEWSEEDEEILNDAIGAVWAADYYTYDDKQEIENWLKSLKDRYTWKPSDEQMQVLVWCKPLFVEPKSKGILESLINDLKKLKEE